MASVSHDFPFPVIVRHVPWHMVACDYSIYVQPAIPVPARRSNKTFLVLPPWLEHGDSIFAPLCDAIEPDLLLNE